MGVAAALDKIASRLRCVTRLGSAASDHGSAVAGARSGGESGAAAGFVGSALLDQTGDPSGDGEEVAHECLVDLGDARGRVTIQATDCCRNAMAEAQRRGRHDHLRRDGTLIVGS